MDRPHLRVFDCVNAFGRLVVVGGGLFAHCVRTPTLLQCF
jgi:hypothetical protein